MVSCYVEIDGEHFDIREIELLDLKDIADKIGAEASLQGSVEVAVDVEFEGGFRLEDAQKVCFKGDVTLEAIKGGNENLLRDIMQVYVDMEDSFDLGLYGQGFLMCTAGPAFTKPMISVLYNIFLYKKAYPNLIFISVLSMVLTYFVVSLDF